MLGLGASPFGESPPGARRKPPQIHPRFLNPQLVRAALFDEQEAQRKFTG
jgi:hypothetical protein